MVLHHITFERDAGIDLAREKLLEHDLEILPGREARFERHLIATVDLDPERRELLEALRKEGIVRAVEVDQKRHILDTNSDDSGK